MQENEPYCGGVYENYLHQEWAVTQEPLENLADNISFVCEQGHRMLLMDVIVTNKGVIKRPVKSS